MKPIQLKENGNGWFLLAGAGLLEIVWAIALKYTGGFTCFWPSANRHHRGRRLTPRMKLLS